MSVVRRAFIAQLAVTAAIPALRAGAQTAPVIRVIGPSNDGIKAVYYGIASGIFRKYGLTVQANAIGSGGAAAGAIISGGADVAFTNITAIVAAHNKGIPMQIIAPASLYRSEAPINAMVVLKDAPIHTGRDLNGKVLGSVSLGDTLATAMQAWVDATGGDSHTVKIVEIPASTAVGALEEGRVAAVAMNEPFVAQAVASGKARVLTHPMDTIASRSEGGAFAVMAPAAAKTPDAMRQFATAMHESAAYTNTHLAETVALVASYSGIAPDVVAHSVRILDPDYVDVRNIQPVIELLAKYGVIERSFPAQDIISDFALKPR